MYYILWFRK